MKRPTAIVTVYLSDAGIAALMRPLRGGGGFQRLLARCRRALLTDHFTVSVEDWERLRRYRAQHGVGGYQARLRAMLP